MKSTVLKLAATAALLTGAAPAFANLVYQTGAQQTGTGLGAVSTVVTVQDNGTPNKNGTESGCVTYTGGNPGTPAETCLLGLQGGDNTAGNAGSNTYLLSDIAGLTSAGQLGFVVNISEGMPGNTATLTDLYLSLFSTSGTLLVMSSRRTTSTPGVLGPPMNLCGLRNTASLYAVGSATPPNVRFPDCRGPVRRCCRAPNWAVPHR